MVTYLGFVVFHKEIDIDRSEIQAITDWPQPMNKFDIRSFLGLENFYRRFILNFSELSVPLNSLLKKSASFIWGIDQQSAFKKIKDSFQSASILGQPDENRPFIVETDASDFALGGVLS